MRLTIEQSKIKRSKYNRFLLSVTAPLQMSTGQGQVISTCHSPYKTSMSRETPYSGRPAKHSSKGSPTLDWLNSPTFIEMLSSGDDRAFSELVRVMFPILVQYVFDLFKNNQCALSISDAEDVAQITVFRVGRAVRKRRFKHRSEENATSAQKSKAEFTTWIFKFAFNSALDRYKQLKSRNEVQLTTQVSEVEDKPFCNIKKKSRADSKKAREDIFTFWSDPTVRLHIEQVLQSLKKSYRDVLVAVYIDGHTPEEIAEREGVKTNTIHQRLTRAKDKFKQAYAKLIRVMS